MNAYTYLKESHFPYHYRREEIQTLRRVIERRRSLFVAGLSGMGKSNLVRFFVSHPARDDHVVTIYVDCNFTRAGFNNELYAAIIDELALMTDTGHTEIVIDSEWALKQTLQNQVKQLASTERQLVIVLDRFEQFLTRKEDLYNYLRSLRDIAGARISYVLTARRFPSRACFGELGELFAPELLWVGPLDPQDTFDSIERDGERLGYSFRKEQKQRLYDLTGGHPGLLKNTCEMAASGLDLLAPLKQIVEQLLQNSNVRDECDELWGGLDEAERSELARCLDSPDTLSDGSKQSLYTKGILTQDSLHRMRFFSPIFQRAIQRFTDAIPSETEIQLNIRGNKVFIGDSECLLTRKAFLLFQLLFEKRGEVVTYDEIASHVWPENAAGSVSDEQIQALKSVLVRKLKQVREAEYIRTHRGTGYELLKRPTKPRG